MYQTPTGFKMLPDVIKNLLIINGIFFLATLVLGDTAQINLIKLFGLHLPGSPDFYPHQLVTHMFMHANPDHILFNMLALWMFGYALENVWGSKRFLIYYMATGLGAALLHLGVNYLQVFELGSQLEAAGFTSLDLKKLIDTGSWDSGIIVSRDVIESYYQHYYTPTVGASGAVFGILLAFGMMFPKALIFGIIQARYFVFAYGVAELFAGFSRTNDGIAHFAHLGGMLFGYLLIRYWRRNSYDRYY